MESTKLTRLHILFLEIKSRVFYLFFSFLLCFAISYIKSNSLLYLFVLPYTIKGKNYSLESAIKQVICLDKENGEENNFLFNLFPFLEKKKIIKSEDHNYDFALDSAVYNVDSFLSLKESSLFLLSKQISSIDISPIEFIFTDVEEAFSSQIFITLIFSFLALFPLVSYNLFAFFIPSLYGHEMKKWFYRISLFTLVWFYFIFSIQNTIIPKLLTFLLEFEISLPNFHVRAETKIYSYCNWASSIFLITNSIFIGVYLVIFFIKNEKVKVSFITARRKWCRVLFLLLASLISPPDLIIQLSLTLGFIFFFEFLLLVFFIYKKLFLKSK